MKLSTTKPKPKPISSPGRIDKFPPPLMRFLRTNAANKSRGRSKSKSSNSMFQILRKKNTTSIETKEPSSPKVTCMGQVRSSKQTTSKKGISGDGAPTKCRCRFWWVPYTECWFVRKRKTSEVSTKNGSKESEREQQQHEEEDNRTVKVKAFASTPPRNALLLTRCKSAPYSSSSLASRFWGSPLKNDETEQRYEKQSESVSKLRFFEELEASVKERMSESERVGELKRKEEDKVESLAFPVVLTRCKSERTRRF